MTPGFCISTDDGREYLRRVREYSARRAHVEEAYVNAVNRYENEWLRCGQMGREALRAFTQSEHRKMSLLENQYNSRNAQYNEALLLLGSEYDGRVLALHYEPSLGDVAWYRPLNREYRVFRRLEPGELEATRGDRIAKRSA